MANEQRSPNRLPLLIVGAVIIIAVVVVLTALLVPQQLSPAYAAAVDFVNAAGNGEDETALALLSDELQAHVADNCPDGLSACIDAYTPPEWGGFLNAVFRRAQPDGPDAFDILLLATYEEGQGFSGVCIYNRAERAADETWQIVRWSGWVSCDLPNAGLSALASDPDAPNRAP